MSKLYIAYGSNLNLEQMHYRCPTARLVGTGTVEDYTLQFKGSAHGAHATICPKPGGSVPVAVFRLEKRDEAMLDRYEGYPSYYFKQTLPVTMGDQKLRGMVYIMNPRMDFGIPSRSYLDTIRQGYRDCGFDMEPLKLALEESTALAQHRPQMGMRFC